MFPINGTSRKIYVVLAPISFPSAPHPPLANTSRRQKRGFVVCLSVGKEGISIPLGQEGWGTGNLCTRATDLAADTGGARGFAQSDRAGVRNETGVRESNWRLVLIIKFPNESISFPPVDGFSFPCAMRVWC